MRSLLFCFIAVLAGRYGPNIANAESTYLAHKWSTYVGAGGWFSLIEVGSILETAVSGLTVDKDGNIIVSGCARSSSQTSGGFHTTYYGGQSDAFVAKYSASGAFLWSTFVGGTATDTGVAVATDSAGNIYVAGEGGDSTIANNYGGGVADGFIVKLSAAGSFLWGSFLGGSAYDLAYGVAVDAQDSAIVVGKSGSTGWTTRVGNHGSFDGFAVKFNSTGTRLWSTCIGGNGEDYASSVVTDGSNNVYVGGSTGSDGWATGGYDLTLNVSEFSSGVDGFAAKLNSSGTLVWSTHLGGNSNDVGRAIALDTGNNVYVAGMTNSANWATNGIDTTLNGGDDAFVFKLTNAGQLAWGSYFGGSSDETMSGMAVDTDGSIGISGTTTSAGWIHNGFDTTLSGIDTYVLKINPTTQRVNGTYLGGDSSEYGDAFAFDKTHNLLVAGATLSQGWVSGGADTTWNGMSRDTFLVKLGDDILAVKPTYWSCYQ